MSTSVISKRFLLFSLIASPILFLYSNCSSPLSKSVAPPIADGNTPEGQGFPTVPRSGRFLGMDILNVTPSQSFTQNATNAQALGAEYLIYDVVWNQIEIGSGSDCAPGVYQDPGGAFAGFNNYLPRLHLKLTLNFSLSTTNIWSTPSNFSADDFIGDPNLPATQNKINVILCRYKNALSYVISKLPDVQIIGLQIGNEIDYLPQAANPNFWANYWSFYAGAAAYARTIRTTAVTSPLPIGVTSSLDATIGKKGSIIQGGLDVLNQTISDYVAVNYYPFDAGGSPAKLNEIENNISSLVSQAKSKKIRVQEFGCQSGTVSGSSEEYQAECFNIIFKVWDKKNSEITHLNLLRMVDLSLADARALATTYTSQNPPDPVFVDYLQTLGIKTNDGQEKTAYKSINSLTKARGW